MEATAQKVVDAIVENRRRFEAFSLSLSDEELERAVPDSTWTVKDFIIHLATLDPPLTRIFEATMEGVEPVMEDGSPLDVDAYNELVVSERRQWPLARIFEEGAKQRAELIASLGKLTEEQTQQKMYFSGDAKRTAGWVPFGLFLAGWSQHDPIHVADMMKALPERADDPDVRAWLDNRFVEGYQKMMSGPPRAQ